MGTKEKNETHIILSSDSHRLRTINQTKPVLEKVFQYKPNLRKITRISIGNDVQITSLADQFQDTKNDPTMSKNTFENRVAFQRLGRRNSEGGQDQQEDQAPAFLNLQNPPIGRPLNQLPQEISFETSRSSFTSRKKHLKSLIQFSRPACQEHCLNPLDSSKVLDYRVQIMGQGKSKTDYPPSFEIIQVDKTNFEVKKWLVGPDLAVCYESDLIVSTRMAIAEVDSCCKTEHLRLKRELANCNTEKINKAELTISEEKSPSVHPKPQPQQKEDILAVLNTKLCAKRLAIIYPLNNKAVWVDDIRYDFKWPVYKVFCRLCLCGQKFAQKKRRGVMFVIYKVAPQKLYMHWMDCEEGASEGELSDRISVEGFDKIGSSNDDVLSTEGMFFAKNRLLISRKENCLADSTERRVTMALISIKDKPEIIKSKNFSVLKAYSTNYDSLSESTIRIGRGPQEKLLNFTICKSKPSTSVTTTPSLTPTTSTTSNTSQSPNTSQNTFFALLTTISPFSVSTQPSAQLVPPDKREMLRLGGIKTVFSKPINYIDFKGNLVSKIVEVVFEGGVVSRFRF